ncbi:hypothetical protein BDB00DRAFT_158641 [Zychaea mexicana]|uniref:uncharacterized protein n=1 Tax=Zychaea mexicana TaxID=64656 RepID=UPI0022FE6276|nr:uncharacterized protein BDB00DRAFT_158641 [Zychaea mexicana]KAI9482621.1 hypothetical protein BDB00DRAFT_158641 [Zychaea mexicana]
MVEWEDSHASHRSTTQSVGGKFKALFSDDEDDYDDGCGIINNHHHRQHQTTSTAWNNNRNRHELHHPHHYYSPIMPSLASMPHISSGFVDPLLTSTAYHIHQAESALSSLKQIIWEQQQAATDECSSSCIPVAGASDTGWKKTLKHKKSGVVVHMKNSGGGSSGIHHKADKTPIFKGEAVIHGFSPQSVFYVIGMRKLWDEQYDDGNLVENLNETTSLTYEVSKPNPSSSLCANSINRPRDMALVEKIECTQDGAIFFACTSVETPRVPRIQGRVRAQIKLQGWVLQPISGGPTPATRVIYVIQENMKGWVPGFAKKSLARRPLAIALVNEYLQKKSERMRAQKMRCAAAAAATVATTTTMMSSSSSSSATSSPFASVSNNESIGRSRFRSTRRRPSLLANSTISARSNHSSVERYPNTSAVIVQPKSTPSSSLSSSQRSSSNTSNGTPLLKKRITFTEKGKAFSPSLPLFEAAIEQSSTTGSFVSVTGVKNQQQQVESSPAAAIVPRPHPLYPTHRHLPKKVETMNLFKRISASLDSWTLIEEETNDDLRIYSYSSPTTATTASRLPLLRADGSVVGKWSAEQLCSAVQCFGARKEWDQNFVDGHIIDRFSQKDYLVYWCMNNNQDNKNGSKLESNSSTTAITSIETDPVSGVITTITTSVHDSITQQQPTVAAAAAATDKVDGEKLDNCMMVDGDANTQTAKLQVDLYGWIFRPGEQEGVVHITWIGNLPAAAAAAAAATGATFSHYYCIPRLANYMNQHGCPPYIRRVAGKVTYEDFDNDTGVYRVAYIAKVQQKQHDNDQQQQSSPQKKIIKKKSSRLLLLWCTDIRIHPSRYPAGIQVTLTPPIGTRAELSSSKASIRVYTTSQEMDGKQVVIDIAPSPSPTITSDDGGGVATTTAGQEQVFTCNGQPLVPRLTISANIASPIAANALTTQPQAAAAAVASTQQQQQYITPITSPVTDQEPVAAAEAVRAEDDDTKDPPSTPPMVTPPQSAGVQDSSQDDTLQSNTPPQKEKLLQDSVALQQKQQQTRVESAVHVMECTSKAKSEQRIPEQQQGLYIHQPEKQARQQQQSHNSQHRKPAQLSSSSSTTARPSTPSYSATYNTTTTTAHNNSNIYPSRNTRQLNVVPEGYKLIPQQQNNNIIIISDELTFNGQQLAVVFLAMVLSYYMGKLACATTYC